ncbi:MAG: HAMP domain-containing protein [Xanthomonadaceae bacterium]|nr:HAMP domain-containing protein [Xanthomonadaceae bacterium]
MTLTIAKKLLGAFMLMAVLVTITGVTGVMMVKKVATSGQMVVEEKVPSKDVAMEAKITLGQVVQSLNELLGADDGLAQIEADIAEWLVDFDMWLSMFEFGTGSQQFKNSAAGKMYVHDQMTIVVQKGGPGVQKQVAILRHGLQKVNKHVQEIVPLCEALTSFRFGFEDVQYTLPAFIYHVKDVNSRWLAVLQKTVNYYQDNFPGLVNPGETDFDRWLAGYKTEDEELMGLLTACKESNDNFYEMGKKIMASPVDQRKMMLTMATEVRVEALTNTFAELQEYVEEEYDSLKTEQFLDLQDLMETVKTMDTSLEDLGAMVDKEMQAAVAGSKKTASSALWLVAVMVAGAVVLALILGIFITRGITGPLNRGVEFAEAMATGDFTTELHVKQQDETGILADALNRMQENLKSMTRDIMDGVETMASSSTELNAISGQLATGADNTAGKANNVATAAEEMNANMGSVAAAMEEASVNVNTVASGSEEMSATVAEIAKNAENAREIVGRSVVQGKSAASKIDELGQAAREIGKVTETINAISSQTNLLALNATIEAARAGEAGKGFAVVANEIKDLAQQTAAATGEIAAKIKGIQDSTGATVTEINEIARINDEVDGIVTTIATAVEQQAATTQEIAENIAQTSQGITEVNENVAQTTEVSGAIAKDIADVNESASEMSNSSAQVRQSAEELSQVAEKLKELMGQFTV